MDKDKFLPENITWFRLPEFVSKLFPATVNNSALNLLAFDSEGEPVLLEKSSISGGAGSEVNDLTAAVTWADIPDANVPESAVTQHEAALNILSSQVSGLATVATSGDYNDLLNQPAIPTAGNGLTDTAGVFSLGDATVNENITLDFVPTGDDRNARTFEIVNSTDGRSFTFNEFGFQSISDFFNHNAETIALISDTGSIGFTQGGTQVGDVTTPDGLFINSNSVYINGRSTLAILPGNYVAGTSQNGQTLIRNGVTGEVEYGQYDYNNLLNQPVIPSAVTTGNGLTDNSGTFELGGTLDRNTDINTGDPDDVLFNFSITNINGEFARFSDSVIFNDFGNVTNSAFFQWSPAAIRMRSDNAILPVVGQVWTAQDNTGRGAWVTPSTGIGGTIGDNQIAFGNASGDLEGIAGLEYNGTSFLAPGLRVDPTFSNFDGRIAVGGNPSFGGTRLGDSDLQTPTLDIGTAMNFVLDDGTQTVQWAAFSNSVGNTLTWRHAQNPTALFSIANNGTGITNGVDDVESTLGLVTEYDTGDPHVYDLFNQNYPGAGSALAEAQGINMIAPVGDHRKFGIYRAETGLTNITTMFEIDGVDLANQVATFSIPTEVPDEAYGASWDGSTEVPTKNAVYDQIESLGGGLTEDSGTFTPVLNGITGVTTLGASGRYVRQGKLVFVYISITGISAPAISTGIPSITGLPFPPLVAFGNELNVDVTDAAGTQQGSPLDMSTIKVVTTTSGGGGLTFNTKGLTGSNSIRLDFTAGTGRIFITGTYEIA